MTFSTLSFIFLFLPVSLLVYHLIPAEKSIWRKVALLIFSVLFYVWGDAPSVLVLVISVLFNYISGQQIRMLSADAGNGLRRKVTVIVAVVVDVAVLGIFKYSRLALPVGMSFYTFSALSYVFDIYYGRVEDDGNVLNEMLYILFFPKLISGPIMQYKDFREQLVQKTAKNRYFTSGMHLFIIGLFKKVLIADNLSTAFHQISSLSQMAGLTAWLGMIFYSLELYFDFS